MHKRQKIDGSWAKRVETHYDTVQLRGSARPSDDLLFHLRKANNAVKVALLVQYATGDTVLDLACGKGGDVFKWETRGFRFYLGIDISKRSVDEAQRRAQKLSTMEAAFQQLDLTAVALPPLHSAHRFGTVSCMFAFHYFWESEASVRRVLESVWQNLAPGGTFLLTIPDAERIVARCGQTSVYTVGPVGAGGEYAFTLGDHVQNCTEFVVPVSALARIAKDFDLRIKLHENFQDFFPRVGTDLLRRMQVLDKDGSIPPPQWDCLGLYSVVVMQKTE
jgi:mRNA (guanine-N7-)-methyltransferase